TRAGLSRRPRSVCIDAVSSRSASASMSSTIGNISSVVSNASRQLASSPPPVVVLVSAGGSVIVTPPPERAALSLSSFDDAAAAPSFGSARSSVHCVPSQYRSFDGFAGSSGYQPGGVDVMGLPCSTRRQDRDEQHEQRDGTDDRPRERVAIAALTSVRL